MKLRIVHVLSGLGAGGAEMLVLNLSLWQRSKGHEVIVLNIHRDNTLSPVYYEKGVLVHDLRMIPIVSSWLPFKLVKSLTILKPDVVHAHNAAWRKSAVACSIARIPCIWTLHGYHTDWLARERRWIRHAARVTELLVGVEEGVAQLLRRELTVGQDKVVCVPNGVPDSMGSPPAEDLSSSLQHRGYLVGMATRMEYPKDHETLVRAFALVSARIPKVHLILVGDGSMRERILKISQTLGVSEKITFTGFRRDVASTMKLMDVFVHSSLSESISVAILEAMSVERSIVATAVGGTPFVLDYGRCGVLVSPGDPEAMSEAILELLTNRETAQQLARNARQRFLEHFTIDAMGKRYLEMYEKAIESFKSRR